MLEMMVVLAIAAVFTGMAVGALQKTGNARAVKSARDSFGWMARRTRAAAVQRGQRVRFVLFPGTGRAIIRTTPSDEINLLKEYGATVTGVAGDSLSVCYDPRGTVCPGGTTLPVTVTFSRGGKSTSATIQALGQVEMNP